MTVIETSLYEYHRKEWYDHMNYLIEMGEIDEDTDSETLATQYWDEFENEASVSLSEVYQDIHYSAGVYLGEISDTSITNRVILHDEVFYDDEGDEYKPEVDMIEVSLMNSNPDLYADNCEEFLGKVLHELADQKMLQIMVDLNGKDSLGGYITSEMTSRRPELVEVLLEWNQGLTYDQVIDFLNETNNGGVTAFMENKGIDW